MDEKYRRIGLAAVVEYEFLNFTFFKMGIKKLNSEVLGNNDSVVNLHKKYGFQEVGLRHSYYSDNGEHAVIMTTPPFSGRRRRTWSGTFRE